MLGLLNTKWISGVFLQKYIMYFLCMRPYANLEGLRVKCYTAWLLKARGLVDLGLMGWIWLSEVFCLSTHTLALLNSWQTFKNWEILIKIWFPALESSLSWQFWAYILTWQQHLEGSVPVWATVTSTPYYIWGGQWPFTAAAVHPFLSFFFCPHQAAYASLVAQTGKNLPAMQTPGFSPRVWKIPWRRNWQPTPVFLTGEFHGQRSLAGYSPWDVKE